MIQYSLKLAISILVIIGILLYIKFELCVPEIEIGPTSSIDNVIEKITNGSLIFLSGNTPGERVFRSITDSPFSHVGILFKENGIPYILDCDIGQGMKEGVRVQDLRHKLARYKGKSVGAVRILRAKQLPSKDDMIALIEKYKDLQFDDKMFTWIVSNYSFLHSTFKNKDRVFCSELVAECMKQLRIIDNSTVSSGYSPRDFFNIDENSLNNGYILDKPIWFDF